MKRFAVVFMLATMQVFHAQSAKDIIDKNIEMTGGLTNWKLLNSVLLQGRVILGVNDEYPVKIYQKRPNLTKTTIMINQKETAIEGYDGKKGYAMNYAQNKLQEYASYVPENFDNDFIDYQNKGFTANYLGKEDVNDVTYHKVELIKNVNKTIYYFDAKTYHLHKEIKKEETISYSDFRKVGNLIMPFRYESSSAKKDSDYVLIINKIEVNREFAPNTFKF